MQECRNEILINIMAIPCNLEALFLPQMKYLQLQWLYPVVLMPSFCQNHFKLAHSITEIKANERPVYSRVVQKNFFLQ